MTTKSKKLWHTKTFWTNAMALATLGIQHYTGHVVEPEAQLSILAGINILLRTVTSKPIAW